MGAISEGTEYHPSKKRKDRMSNRSPFVKRNDHFTLHAHSTFVNSFTPIKSAIQHNVWHSQLMKCHAFRLEVGSVFN
jgi:hypothetical protein